jgi:tetratricopeptide (TPR) repeat protein
MNLGKFLVVAAVSTASLFGCSRSRQDAVLLANEADRARKTDKDGAIAKLEEATRLDPDNHLIWFKLSQVHRDKEDWAKMSESLQGAITAEERASKGKATFANYYAERGYALEQQARKKTISYEEAKAPYTKCIELDPNFSDCYHQLGNVYLWTDDEQKSLEYYTKAIEHDPNELRYYGPLAELYINLGYMKEAEAVLTEAKSRAKANDRLLWGIHVLSSQILQDRGDLSGAVRELEAAKAIPTGEGPEAVIILFNLGSTYAQLEPPRKQEAIEMLKGFSARACKGQKAKQYEVECDTSRSLVTRLGGSL